MPLVVSGNELLGLELLIQLGALLDCLLAAVDEPGEHDELAFLRVENSLLRKKIKELEKVGRGGDKHGL